MSTIRTMVRGVCDKQDQTRHDKTRPDRTVQHNTRQANTMKRRPPKIWTEEQKMILKRLYPDSTMQEMIAALDN